MTAIYGFTDHANGRAILASDDLLMGTPQKKQEKVVNFAGRFVAASFGEETLDIVLGIVAYHYLVVGFTPSPQDILTDTLAGLHAYSPTVQAHVAAMPQPQRAQYLSQLGVGRSAQGCNMFLLDVDRLELHDIRFGATLPSLALLSPPSSVPLPQATLHFNSAGVAPAPARNIGNELSQDPPQLATSLIAASHAQYPSQVGQLGTWAEVSGGVLTVHSVHPSPASRF